MVTWYGSPDTEDVPATQNSPHLDLVQQEHPVPEGDNESSDEYSQETDTSPLAELLEQFWQLKDQIASLKSTAPQSTTTTELSQLTDKLQHLTMMLQPAPHPSEESVHKTILRYTDTLHATEKESILTMTIFQDISTFGGQDSSKLEEWFMDIETAADILTESCTCLTEAKSCSLTCTLICEATQTGKCWDDIRGILRLKLCNANIHTYTSCFMQIQQKDNETLAAYIHHFKIAAKQCTFDNDTVAIHVFVQGLWDALSIAPKIYEKDPQTLAEVIRLVEKLSAAQKTNSYTNTFYSQYDDLW